MSAHVINKEPSMIFAIAAGILLAFYILRMLRLVPYILAVLAILYLIGSLQAFGQ